MTPMKRTDERIEQYAGQKTPQLFADYCDELAEAIEKLEKRLEIHKHLVPGFHPTLEVESKD